MDAGRSHVIGTRSLPIVRPGVPLAAGSSGPGLVPGSGLFRGRENARTASDLLAQVLADRAEEVRKVGRRRRLERAREWIPGPAGPPVPLQAANQRGRGTGNGPRKEARHEANGSEDGPATECAGRTSPSKNAGTQQNRNEDATTPESPTGSREIRGRSAPARGLEPLTR
jgi:hypothetical protein